jgi:DNA-binding response OmpR family regulator
MKLLLIEDDHLLAKNTTLFLEKNGYQVDAVANGGIGLLRAEHFPYAVIILDWMLPDLEGIEVLKRLRQKNISTPVIIATAKSQLEDKIEGFSAGSDDFITKPYTLIELEARISAIIRRTYAPQNANTIELGELSINLDTAQVSFRGQSISLTPKEYAILELLALQRDKIVSRADILHHVWREDADQFTNLVEVHIKNLRAKLGEGAAQVKTVKGKGYLLLGNT